MFIPLYKGKKSNLLDVVKKVYLRCPVCSESGQGTADLLPFICFTLFDTVISFPLISLALCPLLVMTDEYSRLLLHNLAQTCLPKQSLTSFKNILHIWLSALHACTLIKNKGQQFMARKVNQYLMNLWVPLTQSPSYYPQGKGQFEREN